MENTPPKINVVLPKKFGGVDVYEITELNKVEATKVLREPVGNILVLPSPKLLRLKKIECFLLGKFRSDRQEYLYELVPEELLSRMRIGKSYSDAERLMKSKSFNNIMMRSVVISATILGIAVNVL